VILRGGYGHSLNACEPCDRFASANAPFELAQQRNKNSNFKQAMRGGRSHLSGTGGRCRRPGSKRCRDRKEDEDAWL
jgi:hypothetical protein